MRVYATYNTSHTIYLHGNLIYNDSDCQIVLFLGPTWNVKRLSSQIPVASIGRDLTDFSLSATCISLELQALPHPDGESIAFSFLNTTIIHIVRKSFLQKGLPGALLPVSFFFPYALRARNEQLARLAGRPVASNFDLRTATSCSRRHDSVTETEIQEQNRTI